MLIVNQTFHEFTSIKISIKLPYYLYKFTIYIKMRKKLLHYGKKYKFWSLNIICNKIDPVEKK